MHGWKRIKYKELNQSNQDDGGDDDVDGNAQDDEGNFDTDSKDLFDVFLFLLVIFSQYSWRSGLVNL